MNWSMRGNAGAGRVRAAAPADRARRVIVLLLGIVVLSFADFIVTLTHLRTIGMIEANPIAAWLIETTASPWMLAAYKVVTVAVCVGLLYHVRRHVAGELAAWTALAILAAMSVVWHQYTLQLEETDLVGLANMQKTTERWLFLD